MPRHTEGRRWLSQPVGVQSRGQDISFQSLPTVMLHDSGPMQHGCALWEALTGVQRPRLSHQKEACLSSRQTSRLAFLQGGDNNMLLHLKHVESKMSFQSHDKRYGAHTAAV